MPTKDFIKIIVVFLITLLIHTWLEPIGYAQHGNYFGGEDMIWILPVFYTISKLFYIEYEEDKHEKE